MHRHIERFLDLELATEVGFGNKWERLLKVMLGDFGLEGGKMVEERTYEGPRARSK